jgi:hypothetical protein
MHTLDAFRADLRMEAGRQAPRRYSTQRGTGAEAIEVRRRLGDFDAARCPANQLIRETFPGATRTELISVAQMTLLVANQRYPGAQAYMGEFDRVTRRSMDLIVKWYNDNWRILQTIFPDVGLADEHFRPISRFGLPP